MQTLDLSGESKKSDGPLKSLLWPTVDNAWDVDYLGQQGFWVCFAISIFSLAFIFGTASEIAVPAARGVTLVVGILECIVYFVGGIGVRQASWPAALMIFALYAVEHLALGQISVLTIIIGAVLLSNLRATFLASRWKPLSDDEDHPTRFNETLRDKFVDQLPPRAWPILKYPFYILGSLILLLVIAGFAMRLTHPRSREVPNENAVPSATVSPEGDR